MRRVRASACVLVRLRTMDLFACVFLACVYVLIDDSLGFVMLFLLRVQYCAPRNSQIVPFLNQTMLCEFHMILQTVIKFLSLSAARVMVCRHR